MLKETNLSDEYIKAITGKFDLETIFDIELVDQKIHSLGSLPKCISLVCVNLSNNKINSISGMNCLVQIQFLDLSLNEISDISPLESLIELRRLILFGNNINGPPPSCLEKLTKLEKLSFKTEPFQENLNLNVSNPICSIENYRKTIFGMVKNLKWLDNLPESMDEFNCNFQEDNVNLDALLDVKKYNFNFSEQIHLDVNELLSNEEVDNSNKEIDEKYDEFKKGLNEIKKELEKIK